MIEHSDQCPYCHGDGEHCLTCGEIADHCECVGDDRNIVECDECNGTGEKGR